MIGGELKSWKVEELKSCKVEKGGDGVMHQYWCCDCFFGFLTAGLFPWVCRFL